MSRGIRWEELLRRAGVEHITSGPNVKRGEVNIQCPFCGPADPSYHMGLNQDTGYYACWRNVSHRGKSPIRILMAVVGMSYQEAAELAGEAVDQSPDLDTFKSALDRLRSKPKPQEKKILDFPYEFGEIADASRMASKKFRRYLEFDRKFGDAAVQVAQQYDLRYAIRGLYRDRVIIPFYREGQLVSWSGRTLLNSDLRYRDCPIDQSVVSPKAMVYNYDLALRRGGDLLIVVEGAFDAMKLDFFGQDTGVSAVALSTASITQNQSYDVGALSKQFDRIGVLMDTGGMKSRTTAQVVSALRFTRKVVALPNLPSGVKDPGDLEEDQVLMYLDQAQGGAG